MNRSFALLIFASTFSFLLACDHPIKHYTSMGCIPNGSDPATGCPLSFKCPNLTHRQNDKCYLYGKTYNIGETVPAEDTYPFCVALANCERGNGDFPAKFIYAHIDCAEFFRPRKPDCILQYKPASCCSSNEVCGENKTRLATCTIGDRTYREGERMEIPDKPCQSCVCSADFNLAQTDGSKHCYEDRCSFEFFSNDKLYGGAAPVYKDGYCCPWTWRMPTDTDQLKKSSTISQKSGEKCKYGNLTMEIGEALEPINENDEVINCVCAIPPLMHCKLV